MPLLAVILVVVLLVPMRYTFAGLSNSITPAVVMGVGALWLWAALRIVPRLGLASGSQPARWTVLFMMWSAGASWVASNLRPPEGSEGRQALAGLAVLGASIGIALLAMDGIGSLRGLERLLRCLVVGVAAIAALGLVQFKTGIDPYKYLSFPGLHIGIDRAASFGDRSTYLRVNGTTAHPIEFAVVLAVALPIGLHFARNVGGGHPMSKLLWWTCVGVTLLAIPVTVSRSGIVCLTVVLVLLLPTWTWAERLFSLGFITVAAAVIKVMVPGLLGTLQSLFMWFGYDPSVTHRTGDYGVAFGYIQTAPLFGRGYHTFVPSTYDWLLTGYPFVDNQYLLSLIETGVVGLLALVGLFVVGTCLALGARRRSADPAHRSLAYALAVSLVVAAVGFLFFDALAFQTIRLTTFMLVGCAAAMWRVLGAARARQWGSLLSAHPEISG